MYSLMSQIRKVTQNGICILVFNEVALGIFTMAKIIEYIDITYGKVGEFKALSRQALRNS